MLSIPLAALFIAAYGDDDDAGTNSGSSGEGDAATAILPSTSSP
jgi:hypothetical protein